MGYIWNTATRTPERTHLMGWGKLGTGPYSLSYGGNTALSNFTSLVRGENADYGYTTIKNFSNLVALTNAAIFGNIGWGVGKEIKNGNLRNWQITVEGQAFPTSSTPPWWVGYYNTSLLSNVNTNVIGAGDRHILALYGNTLTAFGDNTYNQCTIPSGFCHSGITAVDGGLGHSLVLYSNGSLTGWGLTGQGQLNIPVGLTAQKIAVGYYHNVALKADGTVVCWGGNTYNQCDVPVGLTGVASVGAGFYHSMAIRQNGSVVCWGLNTSGQCNVPASVGTGGMQIAGGSGHTALLKSNGSVICWGDNTYRQSTVPAFPDPTIDSAEGSLGSYWYREFYSNLSGSSCATKVFCTENATWALCTNKTNIGDLLWSTFPGYFSPQPAVNLVGYTSSDGLSGSSFYVKLEGYNPDRHDLFTYPNQPAYGESVMPNGINTAWWLSGTTTERKLDKCFISTYQSNGIFKSYDFYSPVDLSGVSCRPRTWGAAWLSGSDLNVNDGLLGYIRKNTTQYGWNNFNSGFWPNILITKKHAIASKHYSGPNTNLYNVKWIRRDGVEITRNLTRISNLNFGYYNPDMVLYELDQELTSKDLENMSVYNILPKLSGMTGSKLIDTQAYIWKGVTTAINYDDPQFMCQVGRRVWYLDGQDRVYSKRICGVTAASSIFPQSYLTKTFKVIPPKPSIWEPDDVDCYIQIGDSGTPVFITAGNLSNKSEPLEASYFAGQGTTWGRTLFLGLFDAGFGEYGSTFINDLNALLATRGITGTDLLQQIEITSQAPPLPWTTPVGSPLTYTDNITPPDYTGLNVNGQVAESGLVTVGQGTVESWDSTNKILSLTGVSGTFSTQGLTSYILVDNDDNATTYSTMNQYILPFNNGLGTTAGVNDILESEAAGYTFDPNNPFAECN